MGIVIILIDKFSVSLYQTIGFVSDTKSKSPSVRIPFTIKNGIRVNK